MQLSNISEIPLTCTSIRRRLSLLVLAAVMIQGAIAQVADEPAAYHLNLVEETIFSAIDLGVLPVGVTVPFTFDLTYAAPEKAVLEIESGCSCLEVTTTPEVLNQDANRIGFTFTPNGSGPAQIDLQFLTLDPSSGETQSYTLPVKVVGFEPSENTSVLDTLRKVQPSEAFQRLGAYQVVDIRGVNAYEKARVPGSFEYSLDSLQAKEDLLSEKVLLVGESVLKQREVVLLKQLAAKATDLVWLQGGMSAWLRQGLPAEGTWPSSAHASMISLSRWLENGASEDQW